MTMLLGPKVWNRPQWRALIAQLAMKNMTTSLTRRAKRPKIGTGLHLRSWRAVLAVNLRGTGSDKHPAWYLSTA
jgi:hypothetical protein